MKLRTILITLEESPGVRLLSDAVLEKYILQRFKCSKYLAKKAAKQLKETPQKTETCPT